MSDGLLVQGETRSYRGALLADAEVASVRSDAVSALGFDYAGEAVRWELRALRLTLAATLDPHAEDALSEPRWCRVELFGHSVVYGIVSEAVIAGRRFLEVTEPEIAAEGEVVREERSKRYHPNAVYALEEIEEDAGFDSLRVRAGLHRWRDGTWHADHERVAVELDLDALEGRVNEADDEEEGDDDLPY